MIIIASREGQFANRVIHLYHILAFGIDSKVRIIHPFFEEFAQYFPNLKSRTELKIVDNSVLQRTLDLLVRAMRRTKVRRLPGIKFVDYQAYHQGAMPYDLSEHKPALIGSKAVLLSGWLFRSPRDIERNEDTLRMIFEIQDDLVKDVQRTLLGFRSNLDIVVAVHIRGGDYKTFEGGKWYYQSTIYKEKMNQFCELNPGKKVGFVICTNERLKAEEFVGFELMTLNQGFIQDFLALREADFIMGPPSTFSLLASYLGRTPLFFIERPDVNISMNAFKVGSI